MHMIMDIVSTNRVVTRKRVVVTRESEDGLGVRAYPWVIGIVNMPTCLIPDYNPIDSRMVESVFQEP